MLLGFMAIGFAIVYRVMRDAPPPTSVEAVSVPAGAEVLAAQYLESTVQVTYRAGDTVMLDVFDAATGELVRSIRVESQ